MSKNEFETKTGEMIWKIIESKTSFFKFGVYMFDGVYEVRDMDHHGEKIFLRFELPLRCDQLFECHFHLEEFGNIHNAIP